LRAQPVARFVDKARKRHFAACDDRHPVAQALGMGDDMGGENDRRAPCGQRADHRFELALVERVEPRERLVEDHQIGFVDEGAQQLDLLGHAFRELADLPISGIGEAMLFQQSPRPRASHLERHPAQRGQKGDGLGRLHRRVKPAFLGQVADAPGDIGGALVPQHHAAPLVRVDDAQQHAQRRRLARAIGAKDAIDRALGTRMSTPSTAVNPSNRLTRPCASMAHSPSCPKSAITPADPVLAT
jgi:hypothetical protein